MSSSLSSLSSPTDQTSYYTALDSHESTTASSPSYQRPSPYRQTRPLPYELQQHCQIFLEEQLCKSNYLLLPPPVDGMTDRGHLVTDTCATQFLTSILAAGSSKSQQLSKPVPIPPASHLALLSTIAIHPTCTTRADKPDLVDAASHALCYLRSILGLVGPLNADLRSAFQFRQAIRWGGRRTHGFSSGAASDGSDAESEREEGRLAGALANQSSVWSRGQDFWAVVGWAMNCSVLYPQRWRYWHTWLDFMCDVLEADWKERERIDLETSDPGDPMGEVTVTARQQSILMMYMDQQSGRQGSFKMIVKALLADGGSLSSTSFPEVFDKEPRGRQKESKKRKRESLDLENDKFGDYMDEDAVSSGSSEPPTPRKPRDQRKGKLLGVTHGGLIDSIPVRLRLFKLVSLATWTLRPLKELEDLYEDFAAALKLVPLSVFVLIISQRSSVLLAASYVTLLKELFYRLLPNSAKSPGRVDPEGEAGGSLTARMMEHCFVLHAANTVAPDDNAKLSIVVESALQMLWAADELEDDLRGLTRAVEKGIRAREAKVKKKKSAKAKVIDPEDAYALEVMDNSATRMQHFLELVGDDFD